MLIFRDLKKFGCKLKGSTKLRKDGFAKVCVALYKCNKLEKPRQLEIAVCLSCKMPKKFKHYKPKPFIYPISIRVKGANSTASERMTFEVPLTCHCEKD